MQSFRSRRDRQEGLRDEHPLPADPGRRHPLRHVPDLAAPNATETPNPGSHPLLSADLYHERGYLITIRCGRHSYYDAENDDGYWEWEPEEYLNITFDMRPDDMTDKGVPNMVATVAQVLADRPKAAALILTRPTPRAAGRRTGTRGPAPDAPHTEPVGTNR
ncbi:SitI3 family protein [Micromonospora sonchi]|uniref:SitI3 family protein n=1 Tax=Micromonospora sonchi TaxID=1763543 RepID=UPI00227AA931|nr:SitI3 family protein [Micromonospora sonchi]